MRRRVRRIRHHLVRRRGTVAVAVFLAGAAVAGFVLRPGPDLRAGSVELPPGPARVASRVPDAYRIVYRVETRSDEGLATSTERLLVRRPFGSRLETLLAGRRTGETVSSFARLGLGRATIAVAPRAAASDLRADAVLPEATRDGFALTRERRRVAGRTCRVFRVGGDAGDGSLPRAASIGDDYTDVCVDAAGLVLEELRVEDGKPARRRLATHVDVRPRTRDADLRTGPPTLGPRSGGGSVRELAEGSRPPGARFWELVRAPSGFRHAGRYTVVAPQAGLANALERGSIVATTDDVWVRGRDVFVISQGGTLDKRAPFSSDPDARPVRAGRLGRGELLYALASSSVRVRTGGGRFVEILGTLEPSRLVAIARDLVPEPGGELVYKGSDGS